MNDIKVVLFYDGQGWVAHALNVVVGTCGETREAARTAIVEALELYFEDADEEDFIKVVDPTIETVSIHAVQQS